MPSPADVSENAKGVSAAAKATAITYEVDVVATGRLAIEMTLVGGAAELRAREVGRVATVAVDHGSAPGEVIVGADGRFPVACAGTCTVRYEAALPVRDYRDAIAPGSDFLLMPHPVVRTAPVTLVVRASPDRFACGYRRAAPVAGDTDVQRFSLEAWEVRALGYAAIGDLATHRVDVGSEAVHLTVLSGERVADDATLRRWLHGSASLLDSLYGRFPVEEAHVFAVPVPYRAEVYWGRTLPSGGASILLEIGAHADQEDLHRDWILVHELIHLGVPSFYREGAWLDEGLATYFEPVLRARGGWLTEQELWKELTLGFLRAEGADSVPLVDATEREHVYWGGALFALALDVAIRRASDGVQRLDDVLRAVQAQGGRAGVIWTVDRFMEVARTAVNPSVVDDLYARARRDPTATSDLPGFLADLGVRLDASGRRVILDDRAPLAEIRRAITSARP